MDLEDAETESGERLVSKEPGIFMWDLGQNHLYGDGALASLFGLDPAAVFAGLPLQSYVDRIHDSDRKRVARAIHQAVVSGEPYHIEYHVLSEGDSITHVAAFGRCFRDKSGVPHQYAGIVFPAADLGIATDPVLAHIALAHKHAVNGGRPEIADALESVLEDMFCGQGGPVATKLH
jgi:PAS domain-containing protein